MYQHTLRVQMHAYSSAVFPVQQLICSAEMLYYV